jgi:hypothetical protein
MIAGLLFAGCKRQEPAASALPPSPASAPALATNTQDAGTSAKDAVDPGVLNDLTQAVRRFGMEQRRRPADFNEVVAKGYLSAIPQAPPGKKFVINNKMAVVLADQ